ncbi:YheC/YheD family protein [Neobacillus vireti]|uniref:RimK-like ATP-grasp domain protein n=1 Tax=Neobacillus vireti LMG 21834 TaxID=1131730 RepID=A0AB94IR25_9BACI|nr:YheC/YheD family protein [Neobacillus vireti]ETI69496.1 RimK-like ATP-grasp domain protein [Neobacillus vireti LMG 21834]KLT18222.1 hypothetical protein AA980_07725 [Neobacillus vireti]
MVRIGLLHHHQNPNDYSPLYAYWLIAKAESADIFYFTPSQMDIKKRIVRGFVYEYGEWRQRDTTFPDVIYNLSSHSKKEMSLLHDLIRDIPILNFPLENWLDLYETLQHEVQFNQNLIPTYPIKTSGDFFRILNQYGRIIVKPFESNNSTNMLLIERKEETCFVWKDGQLLERDPEQLRILIRHKITEERFFIQPYLLCNTTEGNSYNLQIQLQKNLFSEWTVTSISPKIAPKGSIITNMNSGGSTQEIEPFLKQQFGENHYKIKQNIEHFALQFASQLAQIKKEIFQYTHELNIDIVIDDLQKIWVFDVKCPLGVTSINFSELNHIRNHFYYANYYANI